MAGTQGFRRWLPTELVAGLNELEEQKGSWWSKLVNRSKRDIFFAVRPGYLSVYTGGGEVVKIGWAGKRLKIETHEEYLLLRSPKPYVDLKGDAGHKLGIIQTPDELIQKLLWVQRRIRAFIGEERRGVGSIASRVEHVIDIEVTDRHACDGPLESTESETRRGAIDLAAVDEEGVLRFYEAKLLSNKALRSMDGTPKVIGQLNQYQRWIEGHRGTILNAYEETMKCYRALNGEFFHRRCDCISKVVDVQSKPTLLIFGFNGVQKKHELNGVDGVVDQLKPHGFNPLAIGDPANLEASRLLGKH